MLATEIRGQGPTVVLVHGWAMNGAVWQDLARRLCGSFRVVVPDLPGHGGSRGLAFGGFDDVVDALATVVPAGSQVVGWSLGGQLALGLAARGLPLASLVLIASTPSFNARPDFPHGMEEATFATFAQAVERDPGDALRRFLALCARGSEAGRQVIGELRSKLATRGLPAREALVGGLALLATLDLRAVVEGLSVPALVVHGDRDAITRPAAGRWLARHLRNGRYREIARAGHAPFLSHPEPTCEAVEAFLYEHARA